MKSQIDSFVTKYTDRNEFSPFTNEIRMYFYKETKKTNLIEIKKNPRELDRYSNAHDLIYYYAVKLNGSKVWKKYKKGKVIATSEKQIPTPKFKIILNKIEP